MLALASSLFAQTAGNRDTGITAVEDESWIRHLNKSFNETGMGKTWDLGLAPDGPGGGSRAAATETIARLRDSSSHAARFGIVSPELSGCHREFGQGAPPGINSVSSPVQASSVAAAMERMKKSGREMSPSDVNAMAKESKIILL